MMAVPCRRGRTVRASPKEQHVAQPIDSKRKPSGLRGARIATRGTRSARLSSANGSKILRQRNRSQACDEVQCEHADDGRGCSGDFVVFCIFEGSTRRAPHMPLPSPTNTAPEMGRFYRCASSAAALWQLVARLAQRSYSACSHRRPSGVARCHGRERRSHPLKCLHQRVPRRQTARQIGPR
jgi:hypothetical protein